MEKSIFGAVAWKGSWKQQKSFFLIETLCLEVKWDWGKMNHPSDISTYVSYDYTKFGDDSSTLAEKDVWGAG